ncbi:MAG: glycosyltransferase [Pirellulaceae bacterium]
MTIAIITAGGAGMFCGSCMQDNTLARALQLAGENVVLVPAYTPLRVDEENVSMNRVFLGGLNVFLDSSLPGWKRLPPWMTSWLNHPAALRWLGRFGGNPDASKLGGLTLDMLKGTVGPQQREVHELVSYLCEELRPDVILFSNSLLSGVISELRPRFSGRILCLLQGDDIFLEAISTRWRPSVLRQLRCNCQSFDGFLTHSVYYRDFMAEYLELPRSKIQEIPLTIDATAVAPPPEPRRCSGSQSERFRVGYFARICPEKGVQNLLRAASQLLPEFPAVDVAMAGYVPPRHKRWFHRQLRNAQATAPHRIHWLGSPDSRAEKLHIIHGFDLLCVPTEYHEPKGLFVLEAGLVGVPALLPRHGVFPELVEKLRHGTLYAPHREGALVKALRAIIQCPPSRPGDLSDRVREQFGMRATAPRLKQSIAGGSTD